MDPVTLATSVTTLLIPYLTKAGEHLAEEAGKKLWDTIKEKFKDKPAASGAASELETKAEDPDNQEAFILQLKKAIRDDPDFMKELASLWNQARIGGIQIGGDGVVADSIGINVGKIQIEGGSNSPITIGNSNTTTQISGKDTEQAVRKTGRRKK